MTTLIDLTSMKSKGLTQYTLNKAAKLQEENRPNTTILQVQPNGPKQPTIALQAGATAAQFWEEMILGIIQEGYESFEDLMDDIDDWSYYLTLPESQ